MSDPVRRWVIAYDIRCPRRLARVHRLVARQALPIQYSVFCARLSRSQAHVLAAEIDELIKPEDDVRLYALGENPWYRWYGAGALPDAIWLIDSDRNGANLMNPEANSSDADDHA